MKKLGRNDPCRCGSGKKYKNCHQAIDEQGAEAATHSPAQEVLAAQLSSQGNALAGQGRLEEAAEAYRQALNIHPTKAEIHSNLGHVLEGLGRMAEAIESYRCAVRFKADMPELQSNLGLALQAQGNFEEAEACLRKAISLNPNYVAGHFNLARLQQFEKRHGDAAASCRRVIALKPDDAQAHNNLGFALEELGQYEEAVYAYRKALHLDPGLVTAQKGLCSAQTRLVPEWHVPMMNDTIRNEAYYAALRAAISADSNVFEIGTGSGLLSMMAAKLGAKSVTTCEAEPIIAATARRIIANNGLADRIKLVARKSSELLVGEDMAQPADIMVSEILSSELLGERVLSSIEDAKLRLLKPDARIIPAAASIMIALFGGQDIATNLGAAMSCGFDLRHFNSIVPRRLPISRSDLALEMFSADTEAFRFDFEKTSFTPPEAKTMRIPVTAAGSCLGIVQWIRLEMYEDILFENHPSVKAPASGWTRCAYVFPEPMELKPGQVAIVSAAHNRVFPWFSLLGLE